jgi:hypothetical protein
MIADCDWLTRFVHKQTVHSDFRRISWRENWLQWLLGQCYGPLQRTQNPVQLMKEAVGDCSERSAILKELFEASGRKCRYVGLEGHVVLEVWTNEKYCLADADYGVFYSHSLNELTGSEGIDILREKLLAAGYGNSTIANYTKMITSTEDNRTLPEGSPLSPRLAIIEWGCRLIHRGTPWIFLCCCILVWKGTRR